MINLTPRQHAIVSAAILAAGLLLVYVGVILPAFSQRSEFQERFADLQFQYSRFSGLVNQRDQIKEELEQLQRQQTDAAGFLEEKPEALAAADLQNHVKTIIEANGGNLISMQVVQQESSGAFPDVQIRIHMRAGIEALQQVFYALESDRPTLLLDNLYLQKRNIRMPRRSLQRSPAELESDLIEARFEVTGYIYQAQAPSA